MARTEVAEVWWRTDWETTEAGVQETRQFQVVVIGVDSGPVPPTAPLTPTARTLALEELHRAMRRLSPSVQWGICSESYEWDFDTATTEVILTVLRNVATVPNNLEVTG